MPWPTLAWVAGSAVVVLTALYVVVAGQLLALLEERRADVAAWVGNQVGMDAEIDAIETDMRLLTPVVHLRGVRLFVRHDVPADTAGHTPALAAPAIDLELDTLATLMARRPVLGLLRLEGIELVLEEREDGRFHIRGMPFTVNDPQAEEKLRLALQAIYRQTDILIEHSRLTVESARLPVSALENLRLHMHNDGSSHAVAGSAHVDGPGRLSASFVLRFEGEPLVPRDLAADLYVRVLPASLEGWMPRRDAGDLWVDSLSGGGEAWLRLEQGRLLSVSGIARIDSLAASLADGRKLEGLLGLSTHYRWQAQPDGWDLAFGGLTFRRQGLAWPEADGAVRVRRIDPAGSHADPDNLQVQAVLTRGSVQMLAALADALPESQTALRDRLKAMAPVGQLSGLRIVRDPAAAAGERWRLSTGFAGLGLRSDGVHPGVEGWSGRIELQPDAGYVLLDTGRSRLTLPTLLDAPLTLDQVRLRAVWRRGDNAGVRGWHVLTDRFSLKNADARASGLATLWLPDDGSSPRLSLAGLIEDGRGKAAVRYLPRNTGEGLRKWMGEALLDGHLKRGSFLFEGPVRREPALLRERTFQMRYEADGLTLAYLPGWPSLRGADADIHISNGVVDARGRAGRVLGSALSDIRVSGVPYFPAGSTTSAGSTLTVTARLNGDVADTFTLFRDTPLAEAVPAELLRWNGSGRLGADVRVSLPLGQAAGALRVTVDGTVSGATLDSTQRQLEVSDASGVLRYDTVDGFSARDLRGRALDSDFTGSARTTGSDSRQQTLVDLKGRLRMAPLTGWLKLPALDLLRGDADAALQLRFSRDSSVLEVRSDLRGIASSAPSLLAKSAESAVDTRFTYTLGTSTPRLTLVYGRNFAADVRLRDGSLASGSVALGSTRLPDTDPAARGLAVEGTLPTLVVTDWLAFSRRLAGLPPPSPKEPFTVSRAVAGIVALGNTLQRVDVATGRLDAGVLSLEHAQLRMGRAEAGWLMRVDSPALRGQLVLPDGYEERGDKPLVVQLDSLALPAATAARIGAGGEPSPAVVPRLALALNNLNIGGTDYGSWSLETIPDDSGVQLQDVHGSWRALDIRGQGRWAPVPEGGHRTQFSGTARADDLARVSTAFGFAPNLSSAQANVKFDLGWPGSPLRADPLAARGTLALDVRDGRFVTQSAKTQALRAFGVFNISTWQRRMKLDFTDLYKKGVAFDQLTGDLALDDGRISTTNLVVKGPSALFEVSGNTDLASHAIESRLRVTLPVNSNLYVGCLAGLPACAGIVAFEQLWGDRLEKMTTLGYDVSGVWEDPKITQLDAAGDAPASGGGAQDGTAGSDPARNGKGRE
ncbi:MAG: YhdP family protein [Pseudomonadota bacterium]